MKKLCYSLYTSLISLQLLCLPFAFSCANDTATQNGGDDGDDDDAGADDDNDDGPVEPVEPGDDPNFTIVANQDGILSKYNRKVVVFGLDIYAVEAVDDSKLLHAANVLAQFLDNDEDGTVDNQDVLDELQEREAFILMWDRESDLNSFPSGRVGQDLGGDETIVDYVSGGKMGRFDASLEEVLHIITHAGYAHAYPDVFGEVVGSDIADAMDTARGGRFTSVPSQYPDGAWYTYDDTTCDYACMVTEYTYWALTSLLGAQENRLEEIGYEWTLNTAAKVQNQDAAVYQILTNPAYKLPTVLPDGSYRQDD